LLRNSKFSDNINKFYQFLEIQCKTIYMIIKHLNSTLINILFLLMYVKNILIFITSNKA